MKTSIERTNFSARLQKTLQNAGYSPDSQTQLAREFNERFAGPSITVHAARKWLAGESIPTQEKLRTLAGWLGVTPVWLRFGDDEPHHGNVSPDNQPLNTEELALLAGFRSLRKKERQLAHDFVQLLITGEYQR